jgi:hypothetical protein
MKEDSMQRLQMSRLLVSVLGSLSVSAFLIGLATAVVA